MGLGTLLLNSDQTVERLRAKERKTVSNSNGNSRKNTNGMNSSVFAERNLSSNAGGNIRPYSGPVISQESEEEKADAQFVILCPALGCPALVDPVERTLEIIFIGKVEKKEVTIEYVQQLVRRIKVLIWETARRPYIKDNCSWEPVGWPLDNILVKSSSIIIQDVMPLDNYRKQANEKYFKFGGSFHTIANVVPEIYYKKGFKSIINVKLTLMEILDLLKLGQMYTLYYAPENGLVRNILDDESLLEKPYPDIPLMNSNGRATIGGSDQIFRGKSGMIKNREHLIRLFHPFKILDESKRDYLNVGHITDTHISTLWDFFEGLIFPNYDMDKNGPIIEDGKIKDRKAIEEFVSMGSRFNNPNLNLRQLTQTLNSLKGKNEKKQLIETAVDIILQTGDLIDFNRGFNHNSDHDPDRDYEFNLNWIRYYEMLLLDYELPTFTILGNHDLRLNPYPPHITPEAVHYIFLPLFGLLTGAGMGALGGSIYGAFEEAKKDASDAKKGLFPFLQLLIVPLIAIIVLFLFLSLLLGLGWDWGTAMDLLTNKSVSWWLILIGWLGGLLICLPLIGLIDEMPFEMNFPEAGAFWGSILGSIIMLVLFIVLILYPFEMRNYMNRINNLEFDDFSKLLKKNVEYLRAFGKDGFFYMTERASDWYALVINPFLDYTVNYGNMFIMMGSWEGSEILSGNPPLADDSFSDRQWELILDWIDQIIEHRRNLDKSKEVVPIIGLHTPVFCPKGKVVLDKLQVDIDDDKIKRGIMDEHRVDFIELSNKLGAGKDERISKSIFMMSLTGHSHVYDIFLIDSENQVKWYQLEDKPWEKASKGLHITTICAGPAADGLPDKIDPKWQEMLKEQLQKLDKKKDNTYDKGYVIDADPGQRVLRPAGCRVVIFDEKGHISNIEEISAQTSKWGDV